MHAALEQRPVRHRRTPGDGLVPRCEIHQLLDLAEDEPADVGRADALLDGAEDGLFAVLVVDRDLAAGRRRRGEHTVCLFDRLDERLLAEHVRAALERRDGEIRMRVGGRRDHDSLGARLRQQLGQRLERGGARRLRPRGALLGRRIRAADDRRSRDRLKRG